MKRTGAILLGLALTGGLVVALSGMSSLASTPNVRPTLSAPLGQVAVKRSDSVAFGGSVDAGFTEKVGAHLLFEDPNGAQVYDLDVFDQVTVDSGNQIQGSAAIPGSLPQSAHDGSVQLLVTMRNPETQETSSGMSDPVPVDIVRPRISGTFLTSLNTIRVEFSEAVSLPSPSVDTVVDWKVDGLPPVTVSGEGDVRELGLGLDKDEDATPVVRYLPPVTLGVYRDGAGNGLDGNTFQNTSRDLVAPTRVPSVTSVAGQAPGEMTTNLTNPTVVLSGLRPGHVGQAWAESNGQGGFQPGDRLLGEAPAGDDGVATVATQALGQDGTYTLYGVARDRALCQPGLSSQECPNHTPAPGSTTYHLDATKPAPNSALTLGTSVKVSFTESVGPLGSPSDWAVSAGGPVTGIGGSGKERVLTTAGEVPAGTSVSWAPGAEAYADAAGNQVDAFSIPTAGAVDVKVGQFINRTTNALWARVTWTTVEQFNSSTVDVRYSTFEDPGNLKTVATGTQNDAVLTWQVQALRGKRIRVAVTATDASGTPGTGYSGWIDLVPTDPVWVGAGQTLNRDTNKLWARITWQTSEGFRSPTVDVRYATAGDPTNFKPVVSGTQNDGVHPWQVEALRGLRVRFAVTAWSSSGTPFVGYSPWIDLRPPDGPVTVSAGQVINRDTNKLWARITWSTYSPFNSSTVDVKYATAAEPYNLKPVVTGTQNDGLHSWQVEALRGQTVRFAVTARDSAGNETTGYSGWLELMPPPSGTDDPLLDPGQWIEIILPP